MIIFDAKTGKEVARVLWENIVPSFLLKKISRRGATAAEAAVGDAVLWDATGSGPEPPARFSASNHPRHPPPPAPDSREVPDTPPPSPTIVPRKPLGVARHVVTSRGDLIGLLLQSLEHAEKQRADAGGRGSLCPSGMWMLPGGIWGNDVVRKSSRVFLSNEVI